MMPTLQDCIVVVVFTFTCPCNLMGSIKYSMILQNSVSYMFTQDTRPDLRENMLSIETG